MKIASHIRVSMCGGGAVLFDIHRGKMFDLNYAAAQIWRTLESGGSEDQALTALIEKFPAVERDTLRKDARALVAELSSKGLLVE
ncbi:MAG: PqqD family protein [Bryobacterales bacterium]|nr:PqqD family protein [Bryobacterales bacterium]